MLNEFDKMTGNAIEPSSKAAAPSIWQKLVFHLMVALLCVRDTLTGAAGIIGFGQEKFTGPHGVK